MNLLDKLHEKLFPSHRMYQVNPDDGKRMIVKASLNRARNGLAVGTIIYIDQKDWLDPRGDTVWGYTSLEHFGQGNHAFSNMSKADLNYLPTNEPSYSVVIEKVKKSVDGFDPDPECYEDNIARVKHSVVSSIVIESYLSEKSAFEKAEATAMAFNVPRVKTPNHVANLYIWNTLDDFGTGIKIYVRPD